MSGVITTKVAGSSFSIAVVALNAEGDEVLTSFTGNARVEVLDSSNNNGMLDANGCRSSWTVIQAQTASLPAGTTAAEHLAYREQGLARCAHSDQPVK